MNKNSLIRITKGLLDFMFYSGIAVCVTVPFTFWQIGKYLNEFQKFYLPFCIIFIIAGTLALIILRELRNMFGTVIAGDPFVKENVKSLKRMGICAFLIAAIMLIRLFLVISITVMVLVLVFTVAGLFSIVLSQVFDQAVTYKMENDLTI